MLNREQNKKQTLQKNMRNPESSFFHSIEQNTRTENAAKTKQLEKIAAHNIPTLEDFRTPENSAQIDADTRYVEETERRFSHDEESTYHAKAFEYIFQFNVSQGRWLNDPENDSYHTEAIVPTKYDDYRNRIDIAATVHIPGEQSDSGEDEDHTFGIDLTTSTDSETIRKKILYASNDPNFDGPVGFSQLKYYRDAAGHTGAKTLIPRYCIGVSRSSVDDILLGVELRGGQIQHQSRGPLQQFKILHEMAAQNELFEGPLYEKDDAGTISDEERAALSSIEQLDRIYLNERERIARLLPPWATNGAIDKKGHVDLDKIAQNIIFEDQDRTFETILRETERLSLDSLDDSSRLKQEADRYKRRHSGGTDKTLGHSAIKHLSEGAT